MCQIDKEDLGAFLLLMRRCNSCTAALNVPIIIYIICLPFCASFCISFCENLIIHFISYAKCPSYLGFTHFTAQGLVRFPQITFILFSCSLFLLSSLSAVYELKVVHLIPLLNRKLVFVQTVLLKSFRRTWERKRKHKAKDQDSDIYME